MFCIRYYLENIKSESILKNLIIHPINVEAIKYVMVGVLNAIFTCMVFTGGLYILKQNYLVSLTISWVFGTLLTYTLNFVWVFRPEKKLRFRERFTKYLFTNVLSFIFNLAALYYIVSETQYAPFYVQLEIMPVIVILNFIAAKFWSLKRYISAPQNLRNNREIKC